MMPNLDLFLRRLPAPVGHDGEFWWWTHGPYQGVLECFKQNLLLSVSVPKPPEFAQLALYQLARPANLKGLPARIYSTSTTLYIVLSIPIDSINGDLLAELYQSLISLLQDAMG